MGYIEGAVKIGQEMTVQVEIDDLIDWINDLPLENRFNMVAKILKKLDLSGAEAVNEERKQLVTDWLNRSIEKFKPANEGTS